MVRIIDPTNLSLEDAELLHQFFLEHEKPEENQKDNQKGIPKGISKKITRFHAGETYSFKGKQIKFTHTISQYRGKEYKKDTDYYYKYAVYDPTELLGRGAHGTTIPMLGSLKHRDDMMMYDKINPNDDEKIKIIKSIKMEEPSDSYNREKSRDIQIEKQKRENAILRSIPGSKTKPITFFKENLDNEITDSEIITKQFRGENLYNLFLNDQYSPAQRLQLSFNFVIALQELHDLDIIHGDIKIANAIVNDMELNIVDYGASKRKNKKEKFISWEGTHYYMSPEMVGNPKSADKSTDIYSLGKSLSEFWHEKTFEKQREENRKHKAEYKKNKYILNLRANEYTGNIHPEQIDVPAYTGINNKIINKVFEDMTALNPENRISLNDAAKQFFKLACKELQHTIKRFDDTTLNEKVDNLITQYSEEIKEENFPNSKLSHMMSRITTLSDALKDPANDIYEIITHEFNGRRNKNGSSNIGIEKIRLELCTLYRADKHEGVRNIIANAKKNSWYAIVKEAEFKISPFSLSGLFSNSLFYKLRLSQRNEEADLLYQAVAGYRQNFNLFSGISNLEELLIAQQKRAAILKIYDDIERLALPMVEPGAFGTGRKAVSTQNILDELSKNEQRKANQLSLKEIANKVSLPVDRLVKIKAENDILVAIKSSQCSETLQAVLESKPKQIGILKTKRGYYLEAKSGKLMTELENLTEPSKLLEKLKYKRVKLPESKSTPKPKPPADVTPIKVKST